MCRASPVLPFLFTLFLSPNCVTFDAVFGFTETALLGAKTTLQKHGFRIPEDVALCCMSGTALSTLVHPTITAVVQPVEEMAKESCRLLLAHLQDANKQAEDIVLRGETIFRESFPKKSV